MKSSPHHIDRTAEARRTRAELSEPSSALLALNALSEPSENEEDVPSMPADLRDRWEDRYGEEIAPPSEKPSFQSRITAWFDLPKLVGGLVAATAAILIFMNLNTTEPPIPPVMRGGSQAATASQTVIIYIASTNVSFNDFVDTRGGGLVLEASAIEEAPSIIAANKLTEAIILDAKNSVFLTYEGSLSEPIPLEIENADEIDLSEAVDDLIKLLRTR